MLIWISLYLYILFLLSLPCVAFHSSLHEPSLHQQVLKSNRLFLHENKHLKNKLADDISIQELCKITQLKHLFNMLNKKVFSE